MKAVSRCIFNTAVTVSKQAAKVCTVLGAVQAPGHDFSPVECPRGTISVASKIVI